MHGGERLDPRPRYDPFAFPDTGPDHAALRLTQQGAPGGPPKAGTCTVQVVSQLVIATGERRHFARAKQCTKRGPVHKGNDSLI
ncbi:MAG: hypothetical protein IIC07_00485, partial [Proteobacteria bacterium]|nr:hypothetical protein [Pseudomonadota bacterium]